MAEIAELERLVDDKAKELATLHLREAELLLEYESLRVKLLAQSRVVSDQGLDAWITNEAERYKAVIEKSNKVSEKIANHERTSADPQLRKIFLERAIELETHAIAGMKIHNRYLEQLVERYTRKAASLRVV